MLAEPNSALDMPLKVLIAESPNGQTIISYNSPAYLQTRYGLKPELAKPLAAAEEIAKAIDGWEAVERLREFNLVRPSWPAVIPE